MNDIFERTKDRSMHTWLENYKKRWKVGWIFDKWYEKLLLFLIIMWAMYSFYILIIK